MRCGCGSDRLSSLDGEFADTAPPAGTFGKIEHRLWGVADKPAGWWNSPDTVALGNFSRGCRRGGRPWPQRDVAAPGCRRHLRPNWLRRCRPTRARASSSSPSTTRFRAQCASPRSAGRRSPTRTTSSGTSRAMRLRCRWASCRSTRSTEIPLDAAAKAGIEAGTTLAVTLETKGGSPTGVAQGPIVAVGKVTPI
jgi:hypothetical protein